MIEWILDRTKEKYYKQTARLRKAERKSRMKVDEHIKLCLKCKGTWYYHRHGGGKTGNWSYNIKGSIPTIGKERKNCPKCNIVL